MSVTEDLSSRSSAAAALRELERLYDTRVEALQRARAAGHEVVAHIGFDVPQELALAAGLTPIRLCGQAGAPSPMGDQFLGPMSDGETRSLLHLLLAGGYGPLERLVIAHDTEALVRIFYLVRALHKRDPGKVSKVPLPYFFDLLHMPQRTTGLYNRVRARQLKAVLEGWSGKIADEAALRAAIALCNETRRLAKQVHALRLQGRLTGVQALKVLSCAHFVPREDYNAVLEALLAGAEALPTVAGARVFVTGSGHDNPDLYLAVEAAGGQVVGEDFDWGERGCDLLVNEAAADPKDAIVDRYHFATPAAAKYSVAARAASTAAKAREVGADAVICYVRNGDPAPRWDVPAQRAALAPIPMLLMDDQTYGLADPAPAVRSIADFLGQSR
jgi:benzoyl-CoA reductase/2-hydroxyglutaryl-CoA dehydratase subunit BcrC/BadD/HgdB